MRSCGSSLILFVVGTSTVTGQVTTSQPATVTTNPMPGAATEPAVAPWSLGATANAYFPPDAANYVQPTITADHNRLHLEARYNYEALDTSSVWVGYNFTLGEKVRLDFTTMIGGVFGTTSGYAPGYELTLSWRGLQLYSEGEYLFDSRNASDSFFYTWSELTLAPADWFQFGLVVQRTKVYQTDLDMQRGPLVRFSYENVALSVSVFNPGTANQTYVVAVNGSF